MTDACTLSIRTRSRRAAETAQWINHFNDTRELLLSIARQLDQN